MKTTAQAIYFFLVLCLSLSVNAMPTINGIAVHTELGQDSFIAALFTTTPSTDSKQILVAQEEKQLQVRILADRISARRFKRTWIEGLAINASSAELEAQSRNMAQFSNMLKVSLRKGDIFAIQRSKQSVKVIINGYTLGEIEDTAFFDLLLRTWIGPVPLSSQFRDELLAAGDYSPTLQQLFNDTRPTDQRIESVAAALSSAREKKEAETKPKVTVKVDIAPPTTSPTITAPPLIAPPEIGQPPNLSTPEVKPESPTQVASQTDPETPQSAALETETEEPAAQASESEVADSQAAQEPQQVALANTTEESILEEEEEFTAESLLIEQLYIAGLKKWTYKELEYPSRSLERNEQGMVRLLVTIDRDGKVQESDVLEEPEHSRLTKAALKAVKKSSPFPVVPESVKGETFTFSLPILFKIVEG